MRGEKTGEFFVWEAAALFLIEIFCGKRARDCRGACGVEKAAAGGRGFFNGVSLANGTPESPVFVRLTDGSRTKMRPKEREAILHLRR